MKKILFIALLATASIMVYAGPRAIGGRLGALNGVSYEHAIGEHNMIEVELGYAVYGRTDTWDNTHYHYHYWGPNVQVAATYDWIDPFGVTFPSMPQGEWHWYMGAGVAAGFGWNGHTTYYDAIFQAYMPATYKCNWGYLGAAGRVGVEYDFWFPLQLSVDFRPTLGACMWDDFKGGVEPGVYWELTSFALGVRYKF